MPALPETPRDAFAGPADATHAPLVAYPNDGVLLPPNLGRLEVHFLPGHPEDDLFEVLFESDTVTLSYFLRCHSSPEELVDGACALDVAGDELAALAASNQGRGPLRLRVRGADEAGNWGEADAVAIEFAEQRIDGAVYYWTASNPESIVRFDFGSGQSEPEPFLAPGDIPDNDGSCVGCHAISRQGDKMFLSLGNAYEGQLVYADDLSRSLSDASFFRYNGATEDQGQPTSAQRNRVLTGSFNATGSHFVSVAPRNDPAADGTLFIHDAISGERETSISLPFVPSHPDWSPTRDSIAFTSIGGPNGVSISLLGGGIGMVERDAGGWRGDAP
jgi:hypothetical protein